MANRHLYSKFSLRCIQELLIPPLAQAEGQLGIEARDLLTQITYPHLTYRQVGLSLATAASG